MNYPALSGGASCAALSLLHVKRIYIGKDNISCMALTADTTIAELLREKPESAQILFRFGMGCLGCAIANNETIREAAQAHGIPLEEMLSALGIAEA
jgi:hybrid cluster-associated redox disulfide protein